MASFELSPLSNIKKGNGNTYTIDNTIDNTFTALEVGLNPGPSKHRLQSSRFSHYAMTP